MQRKIIIGAAIGGVLAAGVAGYLLLGGAGLETVRPTRGPAVEAVYATGTVEPVQFVRVGTKIAGRLGQIFVKEGDAVVAGEILAELADDEAAAAVREIEARIAYAKSDLDRFERLYRTGNVSEARLDEARSTYRSTAGSLDVAKARLEEHRLRTPISGVVLRSEDKLEVGDMMGPNQVMFVIGNPEALWIEAEVDEEDIPAVVVGQRALVRADAFPDDALEGDVARITPFGDPVARTYRVYIGLPDDTPLLAGMTTEVNIVVREEDDALLVPVTALAGNSVWLVEDGRAIKREVKVGAVGEELAEVRSGLSDGDVVIDAPPADLKPGTRVNGAAAQGA